MQPPKSTAAYASERRTFIIPYLPAVTAGRMRQWSNCEYQVFSIGEHWISRARRINSRLQWLEVSLQALILPSAKADYARVLPRLQPPDEADAAAPVTLRAGDTIALNELSPRRTVT